MLKINGSKFYRVVFIVFFQSAFFCWSFAAEDENTDRDVYHEIDSYVRYMPARSVQAMSGEVEVTESSSEYGYGFKVCGKLPVKLSLDTQYIGIENTLTNVGLPAHLNGLTTDLETTLPFFKFDNTYFRLGVSPSFYDDDWNFESSSFRIPSRYFLIYRPNQRWTFIGGAAVYPDYENQILPILGFIYKPNERLVFNLVPKRPNISYMLNERATLFAEGGGAYNSEFEVSRGNAKNVVLRYKETHLGAGVKFRINKFIETSITGGGVFNRSLKYRDNQGKVSVKDGAYAEFRVEIKR